MGLVSYTVYFNKQQSNSSFTHSKERGKKSPCQLVRRLCCTKAMRILTAKRAPRDFNIHSVDMSEEAFYEGFNLFIWKSVVWTVPWGSPPGQTTFSLCKDSHLMRINTCAWSWLQIVHYKLRKGLLSLHFAFFPAFMAPTSSMSQLFDTKVMYQAIKKLKLSQCKL